ncbi:MAG: alpha/beta hydrolase [Rubrivivax sp.]|nr:alpha/beta hydrolase [Rubrivivax sp.]
MRTRCVHVDWAGRRVRLEVAWVGPGADEAGASAPLMVFLHEGLGSVAMWRDFPERLCTELGLRGLVYSRPGYGRSTPRAPGERWHADFMHRQAHEVLPALLEALAIDPRRTPTWLYGHSDGGSIALLYAARCAAASPSLPLAGAIVAAPHILVEDISVRSIEAARRAYVETDLRQRLARYHDDPDSPFWGWNDIWLDPAFRRWSIEEEIGAIRCPVLALQGVDDEYGTLEQIHGIARRHTGTRLVELPECGHSPHRDQPDAVIHAVRGFVAALGHTAKPSLHAQLT